MKKLIFSLLLSAAAFASTPLSAMDPNKALSSSAAFASTPLSAMDPDKAFSSSAAAVQPVFEPNQKVSFSPIRKTLPFIRKMEDIRDIQPLLKLGFCVFQGNVIDSSWSSKEFEDKDLQAGIWNIVIIAETNKLNTLIAEDPSFYNYINLESIRDYNK